MDKMKDQVLHHVYAQVNYQASEQVYYQVREQFGEQGLYNVGKLVCGQILRQVFYQFKNHGNEQSRLG